MWALPESIDLVERRIGCFSSFLTRSLMSVRANIIVTKFGTTCPDIFGNVSD
jgi:hypothetical protein